MITTIRDYFRAAVYRADPDLHEHITSMVFTDIPDQKLDDTYFLFIGNMSSTRIEQHISSNVNVNLTVFKKGYNDAINNHDNAYNCATRIQTEAMRAHKYSSETFIKNVVSSGISVETIENDDNSFSFTIQFEVELHYK